MAWKNDVLKGFKAFLSYFREYKSQNHRYKIVNIFENNTHPKISFAVLIGGVRKQILLFSPNELLHHEIIKEFSEEDIQTISFYSTQRKVLPLFPAEYYIDTQEISSGKTTFTIKNKNHLEKIKLTSTQLYQEEELLSKFSHKDLKIIISTAILEQSMIDQSYFNEKLCL